MITQQLLKEKFIYDEKTGKFYYTSHLRHNFLHKVGEVSGSLADSGHLVITIKGKRYQAARLAWFYTYGTWPQGRLEFINRNCTDIRIDNLRVRKKHEQQRSNYPESIP